VRDPDWIDRLYDGDVDDEQAKQARDRLTAEPRAAARFERLQLIGSLVREVEAERELPADFTERVMERLEPGRSQRPLRISRLYPALAAAAGSLALAAAVVLWVSGQSARGPSSSAGRVLSVPSYLPSSGSAEEALAHDAPGEPPTVTVASVDFGATQGAIFLVSAGVTDTMVVWTLDEPER
jgi:negative regulator of sigma E activity